MRILHTADLHYGMTWNGHRRMADQDRVLAEILGICESENVDLLLIAGDVFHDRVAGGHINAARRLLQQLVPQLRHGRAVFMLRGNHDPIDLFRLMSLALDELAGEQHLPLVVASLPGIYRIPDHNLQVVALPYLTPQMLRTMDSDEMVSAEAGIAGLSGLLAQQLERLCQSASSSTPSIFAGHVSLTGAKINDEMEFESGYHRELWLEPARLPQFTSYNALGHIHLYQQIRGAGKPTWYAGGPDRLNLGERDYSPRVLLVDTPDSPGGEATVTPVEIEGCTPFVMETLEGMANAEAFCATQWPRDPLGQVALADIPAAARLTVVDQVRAVAPRLRIRLQTEQTAIVVPDSGLDYHNVHGTVSAFLNKAYADRPERRALLQQAFATLWDEQAVEQEMPA